MFAHLLCSFQLRVPSSIPVVCLPVEPNVHLLTTVLTFALPPWPSLSRLDPRPDWRRKSSFEGVEISGRVRRATDARGHGRTQILPRLRRNAEHKRLLPLSPKSDQWT